MGLSIAKADLLARLERAIRLAESSELLPDTWGERTRDIGNCPSETYVAAFGTALLARATHPDVDVLSIKMSAGPRAYSMRGVVAVLAGRAEHYGYDLGVTGREPLNNQPWFSHERVDQIVRIKAGAKPFHNSLLRYLRDLQGLDPDTALLALAAFLRVRLSVGQVKRDARHVVIENADMGLIDVLVAAERLLAADPEGGRRAQAVVTAMLDAVRDDISTARINDPRSFDVFGGKSSSPSLAVEVKHKAVDSDDVLKLAAEAARAGADKALYVALSPVQQRLDSSDLRRRASRDYGVYLVIAQSVEELAERIYAGAVPTTADLALRLPGLVTARLVDMRVSQDGIDYWTGLFVARA